MKTTTYSVELIGDVYKVFRGYTNKCVAVSVSCNRDEIIQLLIANGELDKRKARTTTVCWK